MKVRIAAVEAHLSGNPEFTRRFGQRVRNAGGKYNECRGHSETRYVTLPMAARDLMDEICATYPKGLQTTLVARGLDADGFERHRIERSFGQNAGVVVHYWNPRSGIPAVAFLEGRIDALADKFDWAPHLERWSQEDAATAARQRAAELDAAIEETRNAIAEEALRLLDGANDMAPLLELAQHLKDLRNEAGYVPEAETAPTGPRPSY